MRHAEDGIQLSPREQQIVQAVSQGDSNKAIAQALGIGTRTVANYLSRLFEQLRVHNRAGLTEWANQNPGSREGEKARRGLNVAPVDSEIAE
jgi:DNA-binding NarL/FixJ family response regulator